MPAAHMPKAAVPLCALLLVVGCNRQQSTKSNDEEAGPKGPPIGVYLTDLAELAAADRQAMSTLVTRAKPFDAAEMESRYEQSKMRRGKLFTMVDGIPPQDWRADARYRQAAEAVLLQLSLTVDIQMVRQLGETPSNEVVSETVSTAEPYYDAVEQAFLANFTSAPPDIEALHQEARPAEEDVTRLALGAEAKVRDAVLKRMAEWPRSSRPLRP